MKRLLAVIVGVLWMIGGFAQSFPYHVSVQAVPGHCYDDAHLVFTMTDDNDNVVQIDPQTHNAENTAQYPLYNVQYHYQNIAGGGVQYDYSNDIMLMAGTYSVGVTANVPTQGGYALVDTTIYNVQIATTYTYLETNVLTNVAYDNDGNVERYGFRASFHCADVGRIQLRIVQGSFPYTVTILDEQQDTVRHEVFYHRANNGTSPYAANYRDYYTFDNLPIGTYSIYVSDSCGYTVPLTFNIPDYEPTRYLGLVRSELSSCMDETVVPFVVERWYPLGYSAIWCNYNYSYLDSILMYRFVNPGGDTTEWKNIYSPGYSATWVTVYDTLSNYCDIFYDTIRMQLHDLCHDTLMTYSFRFVPQFGFLDSMDVVYRQDTIIHDTCATHLLNGDSTQMYKIGCNTWTGAGKTIYGGNFYTANVPFRYYRCPLSYDVWSLPDSTLLGHSQSDEFTGLGTWETFFADTSLHVYVSVTDAQGCTLADKDTVLVYQTAPVDDLLYWFECHNDKDDDGKDHCCPDRYLWIQEHGVDADVFRRDMTLRLMESPLYNQFNFTAIRQNGVWTVTPDDPNNHSTYVEFSYEDGWRAIVRDSICLAPGRYTFEVSTDCGVDTITYSKAGYYYDTLAFVSAPQYEIQQRCGEIVYTQVSTGLESHMYFINPEVSNDIPEDTIPDHPCSNYSSQGGNSYRDSHGRNVIAFSIPGTYVITNYAYNFPYTNGSGWCTHYIYHYDTVTVEFAHLDFDMVSALLCGSASETGVVTAQAINGNAPYIYTLYDQGGAVIASNSTGIFEDVPMTVGQQFTIQVTDSCSTSFSINVTAALLTHESLLWEQGPNAAQPHCVGDSVHLTAFAFPPPATYHWTGPNGFSSDSQTNDFVIPQNGESGWYKVEILNSVCGPAIMDSVYVSVAPTPQVSILGADTVCYGETVTLLASTDFTYGPSFVWNIGDTTTIITVNLTQTTEYSVTVTFASGCIAVDTFKVISVKIDGISDIHIPDICAGESAFVTVGHFASWVEGPWVTATTDSTFVFSSPADLAHDTTVNYIIHCHNHFGCGYDTMVSITFYARNLVTIDTTACNSLLWNGVTYTADTSFTDSLTNIHGCDSLIMVNVHVITTPSVVITGLQSFCPGDSVTLTAATDDEPEFYAWSNGANTPSVVVTQAGLYTVTVTFAGGCTAESPSFHLFVTENPIVDGFLDDMVAGDTQIVVIGTSVNDNLQYLLPQSTLTYSEVTFLPDGVPCGDPPSCSYKANMSFSGFPDTAVIHSADEIRYIRLNMEHSWVKDLYINLTCPNGQKSDILKKFNGNSTSPCLDSIGASHIGWQNNYFASTTTSIYFGIAYWNSDNYNRCDSSLYDNQAGVGWNYCWSNNTSEGYQYAPGAGSLIYEPENVHLRNVGFFNKYVVDSSDVAAGTQFYHPDESFDSLVGCPVNGLWRIELIDGIQIDNGYIFECELAVAEHLSGTHYAHVTEIDFEGMWAQEGSTDSIFLITPPENMSHDTVVGYTFTLIDENGCLFDTTIYIHIYAHKHTDLYDTVYADELPYVWNGLTLTHAGCGDTLLYTTHGADSVVTMHLSVIYPYDTLVCANDFPQIWHGQAFIGVDSITVTHALGCDCDSVEVLWMKGNPFYRDTTNITVCESALPYLWEGLELYDPGFYSDSLTTSAGCDSIIFLNLNVDIVYVIPLEESICQGDTFLFFNQVLTEAGVYADTLQSVAGCDSVILLTLTVNPVYNISLSDTICAGDTLWFFDQILTETGVYTETMQTAEGCDSVVVMHLTVNPNTSETIVVSIVENDLPYEINQISYDTAGTYIQHIPNAAGCDSLLTIHLYVANNIITYLQATICQNMLPAVWHGHVWYGAGVVVDTLEAASGADSLVVLTLSVGLPTESEIYDTILQNDLPYPLNDNLYYAEGDYEQVRMNLAGCDSTITLHLTVLYNVRTELDTTVCDSQLPVIWNGFSIVEAGTDSVIYEAANGVDSVVVMTVNVNASSDSTLIVSVIENNLPYVLNGFEYNVSGTYTQNFDNAIGCDSTLTMVLTVLYNVRVEVDSAVCDSLLPITWNGVGFSGVGSDSVTIVASSGVDSTVVMAVTVVYPTEGTFEDTVVENNLPYQLNGYSYDSTGVYTQHLTNVNGCDSTLTVGLTVLYNVTSEADSLVCPSALPLVWNGKTFTAAGVQSAVLTAANGVDSTVTMTLNTLPSPTAHISGPSVLCADSYTTLTADSALSYLWSNGMTTQSIDVYVSGYYSVTVSNEFGCTAVDTFLVGNVVTVDPLVSINLPDMCAGESYTFTAGYHTGANFLVGGIEETHSVAETVFLPDGIYCSPYGCSYQSPLTFTDFTVGSTVTSVNDIRYVRLNMEHSFAGDIYINITCPNGQKADIMKYAGTGTSSCTATIPSGSIGWQSGNNASQGTFFGMAYDYSTTSCNASASSNAPGIGWNYCWSNNTDQGYTYAPGAGSLIYRSVNAHAHPYAYGSSTKNIFDSSNVAAGTQFYHPDQSFASLIGCPLNGNWYIEVVDGYSQDNGYLFGWELALASTFATTNNTEMVAVTVEGPWATMTDTTTFVITPPADLEHDTVVAYTVHFYDENGCGYDTIVFLNIYTHSHIAFDTTVCGSFVWNGTTYTQSQAITWNGVNAHGCDSTVTISLIVNNNVVTYDTLQLLQNQLPYYFAPHDTTFPSGSPAEFQFSYTLSTQQGCDSVIMQKVIVFQNYSQSFDTTVCADALPLTWHGHTFTTSGTVTDSLHTAQNSDSVLTYTVTVDLLSASIDNITHIVCYGDNTGAATATVTSGIAPLVYLWTNGAGASVSSTTQISSCPAGNYTFTVTDAAGCLATATVTLNTLHGQMLPGDISGPQTLCFGDTLGVVTGTAATGDGCTYQWQISTDNTNWTPLQGVNNTQNYTFQTPLISSIYLRRAWISADCGTLYSDTLFISVWPVSSDTLYDDICVGQPYQEHGFDISETETVGLGTLTSWIHYNSAHGCDSTVTLVLDIHEPQETDLTAEICEGTGYYENGFWIPASETVGEDTLSRVLNLQTVDGCDSVVRLAVTIIDTALHIVSPTADFCEDMLAELFVVTNMSDYEWSTGEMTPNITVTVPGVYKVTASEGGCSVTARYVIEPCVYQLYLPNAITPGRGEGLNDYFFIPEQSKGSINLFEISIFNRWGELVFYSTDKNFQWNGEYKGQVYHQTVYNYIIEYTDSAGHPFRVTGSITVL